MPGSANKTIVNISFAVPGSSDPQQAIEQANEFVRQNKPAQWSLVNLTVRDPSYSSDMLHALTTGAN